MDKIGKFINKKNKSDSIANTTIVLLEDIYFFERNIRVNILRIFYQKKER